MIESITLGYALVFIVIILMMQVYLHMVVYGIFKEIDAEDKPHWFYEKIKYLYDHKEKLPNHVQGKIDEVIVCLAIMFGLIVLTVFLFFVGYVFK